MFPLFLQYQLNWYQIFLHASGNHYIHHPNGSKILVNLENPDFNGEKFDFQSLEDPLPTFLKNEFGDTEVKEADRLEILRKLLAKTTESMNKFDKDWKELIDGCFIR